MGLFQKDRHTYDKNVAAPNESDGMDPDDVDQDGIRLLNKFIGVTTTKFGENGMGSDNTITSVDINGVVDQINQRQGKDGAMPYVSDLDDPLSEYDLPIDGRRGA